MGNILFFFNRDVSGGAAPRPVNVKYADRDVDVACGSLVAAGYRAEDIGPGDVEADR